MLELEPVVDALVVDLPLEGDGTGWIILFVVVREGAALDEAARRRAPRPLSENDCSPRHVPDEISALRRRAADAPGGKVVEFSVKRILLGAEPDRVVSRGALANP